MANETAATQIYYADTERKVKTFLEIMEHLGEGVHTIAIDGRCASGKSTLAERLAELTGGGVIHMDDFFLPVELRSKARAEEPGGNVHYERFMEEVLPHLKSGERFTYRRFDCHCMDYNGVREVAASRYRIVEGAYSHHPKLGDYADILVFSDVEAEEQLARIRERNGEEAAAQFKARWIPLEERYFEAYDIAGRADLCV